MWELVTAAAWHSHAKEEVLSASSGCQYLCWSLNWKMNPFILLASLTLACSDQTTANQAKGSEFINTPV